ncbi:GGDEF domain-containing protein [Paraliomyxa miuraensis]|uniref:GGDEF domain-containing protein n=1 Tax=Paraliomyxa miuraensis TaxID=376150 RepID=UPI0022566159|nr:GGDEF domain-containing protein [Paraliomyxa miuraensis]MCX4242885.1 GGDEF domain-containing protein [Paraliomyxa miuraensis]
MNEEQTVIHKRVPLGGAPRERNAYLIVLSGRAVGQMFKLSPGDHILGRSVDANIRLDDEGVSRSHAMMRRRSDGTVELSDLDSTNGTYVNGAQIRHFTLSDGDRIQIGSVTILKFSYQDSLEEQFQQQLYESATRDPLTQAYNKRAFNEQLDKDFSHAQRHDLPLSLVMLDVDHFKRINDTHGHPAGDHVLQRLAATIMASLRTEDAFCRVGGEEFAVIMRDCTEGEATQLAERLRRLVASTQFVYGGQVLPVTISLGVASFVQGRHSRTIDLVEEADRCLYEAKRRGRNRACHPADLGNL